MVAILWVIFWLLLVQTVRTARRQDIEVDVSGLHPGQFEVFRAAVKIRFVVLVAGRRWGKTRVGVARCIAAAVKKPGGYLWVSPTYPLAEEAWDILKEFSRAFPDGFYKIEEAHTRVRFGRHGWVRIVSAERPDALRSRGLRGAVLDECGLLKPDVWPTLRPALADLKGWALFIGTPKGRNWYYRLYERAKDRPGWARFQRHSKDNPRLDDEELADLAEEIAAHGLSPVQEIEAQFLDRAGAIFKASEFRYWWYGEDAHKGLFALNDETETDEPRWIDPRDCWLFQTVDTASSEKEEASFFVIATWAVTPERDLLLIDRFREHAQTTKHLPTLRATYRQWRPSSIGVENAHVGIALVQAAIREGLPVIPIRAERDKVSRARVAQARYEAKKVFHPVYAPWLKEWEDELLDFPDGDHDDQVDTLSYAAIHVASGAGGKIERGASIWTGKKPVTKTLGRRKNAGRSRSRTGRRR